MEAGLIAKLGSVAARRTVVVTHYGRKSGKPYKVTIWFAVAGEQVYLTTANVQRQWVQNVRKTPQVSLLIGGVLFEGEARFLDDPSEHARAMAAIREKYWIYTPLFLLWGLFQRAGWVQDRTGSFEVTLTRTTS